MPSDCKQSTIDYRKLIKYARLVTKSIFLQKKVYTEPDYINSVTWQRRRSISTSDFEPKVINPDADLESESTIKYDERSYDIGPYELGVLNEFIECEEGYTFFRGGTKSGKSSLLYFLQDYCEKTYFKTVYYPEKVDNISIDDYVKILIIDVAQVDYINEKYNRHDHEFKFFKKVLEMVLKECRNIYVNGYHLLDSFYDVYNKFDISVCPADNFSAVINRLSLNENWTNSTDWKRKNTNEKINDILNIFNESISNGTDLFIATIAPLWYFSNSEYNTFIKSMLFVIDNIDPHDEAEQQSIAIVIRNVCSSDTWNTTYQANKLNIILPVRLSTFIKRIGQIGGHIASTEHKAFYPSDVVFYRLNYYFFTEGKHTIIDKIPQKYRNAINLRLYSLWAHLSDPKSYFRKMMDAISGTNINHANILAQNWCLCSNFGFGDQRYNPKNNEFYEKIVEDASASILIECLFSFIRALEYIIDNELTVSGNDNLNEVLNENVASDLIKSIAFIYKEHKITCNSKHDNEWCVRTIISKRIHSNNLFEKAVNNFVNFTNDPNILSLSCRLNSTLSIRNKINKNSIINFYNLLISKIPQDLPLEINLICEGSLHFRMKITQDLVSFTNKFFEISINGALNIDERIKPLIFNNDDEIPYNNFFIKHAPYLSRFNASYNLLQPKGVQKETIISTERVFTVDDRCLQPIALHILYILYFSPDYRETFSLIKEFLNRYDYDYQSNSIRIFQNLVRIDRRLIFCEVNDYEIGFSNVVEDYNVQIILSNAGKAYVKNLIFTPPYLEWCFIKFLKKQDATNMTKKIRVIMENLIALTINEIDSIEKNWNIHDVPNYFCACFDAMIKSLDYYIPSLISHYKNIDRNSMYSEYAMKTDEVIHLIKFIFFNIDSLIDIISNIFKYTGSREERYRTLIEWQYAISWAKFHIDNQIKLSL